MATTFAIHVALTNYKQLGTMCRSVKELQPQVFINTRTHAFADARQVLQQHLSEVWFRVMLSCPLGVVLFEYIIQSDCVCSKIGREGGSQKMCW